MISRKITLLSILTMSVASLHAQQTQMLTLQQAVKMGLENSKNLKLSAAKVAIANAKYNEAIDATIPSLKLSAGYTRLSEIDELKAPFPGYDHPIAFFPNIPNTYSTRASMSETIFSGFRLKYAQAAQKYLQQAASADAQKDSDEIAFAIVNAYYNIYKIKQSQKIVADNLKETQDHLTDVNNWEKNGIARHNEVLKWELQQSNAELAQIDLENNLSVANYNMDIMLGLKEDVLIDVDSSSMFVPKELKSMQEYMQQASSNRGDFIAMDLRNKALENSLKVSRNSYYPTVAVGANYNYNRPNTRIFPITDEFKNTWDAGITLSFDLTNLYSNKHIIAESKANVDQAEQQKNILLDAIKMEVNQNYLSYTQSLKKIEVLNKSVSQAAENNRITNNKYKNQLVLQSELADADNTLLQSKINLILAKADAELAYYKLMKSIGTIK